MKRFGVIHGDIFPYPRRALVRVASVPCRARANEAEAGLAAAPVSRRGGVIALWAHVRYARGAVVRAVARRRRGCTRWPSPESPAVIECSVTSRRGRTQRKAVGEFGAWPLDTRLGSDARPRAIRASFGWPESMLLMCIVQCAFPCAQLPRGCHVGMLPRPLMLG